MKKLTPIALAFALTACTPKAERAYGFDQIMPPELADCKVFMISDGGRHLYVTRCGFEVMTTWSRNCGKGCTVTEHSALVPGSKETR